MAQYPNVESRLDRGRGHTSQPPSRGQGIVMDHRQGSAVDTYGGMLAMTSDTDAPRPDPMPAPPALYRVEILSDCAFVGCSSVPRGTVVEVNEARARQMHALGVGRAIDPDRIKNLPSPPWPAYLPVAIDPFPADARIPVNVISGSPIWLDRVYRKGDTVVLPERIAIQWVVNKAATVARGAKLSPRGETYRRLYSMSPSGNVAF
jgi:hypothetical protein